MIKGDRITAVQCDLCLQVTLTGGYLLDKEHALCGGIWRAVSCPELEVPYRLTGTENIVLAEQLSRLRKKLT